MLEEDRGVAGAVLSEAEGVAETNGNETTEGAEPGTDADH